MLKRILTIRKTLGAVSLLWLGSLLGAGLAFTTQVILARELTPTGYGNFAAVLASITLLAPLAGFGVQGVWLKFYGAEGWQAGRWLPISFRFVMLSTLITYSMILGWGIWGAHDEVTRRLFIFLSPVVLGYLFVELVTSKLLLEERFKILALWQLFPHLTRLLAVLLLVGGGVGFFNIDSVALIYSLVAFFVFIIGLGQIKYMNSKYFALKGHGVRQLPLNAATIRVTDVAKQAWPFGLAAVFHLIYFQSSIVLLKYIAGDQVAGIYNVAFTVMAAVYLLPSVIYQKVLLPKFHRWASHDRARLYQVYRKGNVVMLMLGVVAMFSLWGMAFWGIPLLFGDDYKDAVMVLNVLAFSAPIVFVASSVGATLVTQEHMARKVKYMGAVSGFNVVLNLMLIPSFGLLGAAITTVVSNFLLLAIYYVAAQKLVFGSESQESF